MKRTFRQWVRCEYVIPPMKANGVAHTVACQKPWSPRARFQTAQSVLVLEMLRHPAAREALEESGNREQRRGSKVAPGQLDRKKASRR